MYRDTLDSCLGVCCFKLVSGKVILCHRLDELPENILCRLCNLRWCAAGACVLEEEQSISAIIWTSVMKTLLTVITWLSFIQSSLLMSLFDLGQKEPAIG